MRTTALCNLHGAKDPLPLAAFKRGDKKKAEEENSHSASARLSRFPVLSNIFFFLLTEHKKKFKTAGYKVELHKQQQPVLSDLRQGDQARSQRWARTPCPSTRGQEQSSGPPVQRNPLRGTVQPPREG